jgi:hypothetical protein
MDECRVEAERSVRGTAKIDTIPRAQITVPQQFLDRPDVIGGFEEMCGDEMRSE